MSEINSAFLLLGSNIEPKEDYITRAQVSIVKEIGNIVNESSVYQTDPVGFNSTDMFLNRVVEVETTLRSTDLLEQILSIENKLGRIRMEGQGYSSRTIDIDIIYFNNDIINDDNLIVPHPRMHKRLFTLIPLVEIDPKKVHPVFNKSNSSLLSECDDTNKVIKIR